MPPYQLQIAIALNASAVLSAVLFAVFRERDGKIQLPIHVDIPDDIYPDGDPFDVTTPEDLVDGYPLGEENFWARVRVFLSFLFPMIYVYHRCGAGKSSYLP